MVSPMFTVLPTMTGFHGGLRRAAAAGVVGAMLVLSAGIPAANAAGPAPQDSCFLLFCSPSPPKTAEPTPTQPPPDPGDPPEAPAPPGTPSNPTAAPAPAPPAEPSNPGPTEGAVAPSEGPNPNPSASPDNTAAVGSSGASSTGAASVADGSGPNTQQAQPAGGMGSAGQGIAPASGVKDNGATSSRNLETASMVNQDRGNIASLWWGIVLLAVAGMALVIFFRLRRTEKLLTMSA